MHPTHMHPDFANTRYQSATKLAHLVSASLLAHEGLVCCSGWEQTPLYSTLLPDGNCRVSSSQTECFSSDWFSEVIHWAPTYSLWDTEEGGAKAAVFVMKHEAVWDRLVLEKVKERRNILASARLSPRRPALYRRVGEFGAGAGK